MKRYLYLNGKKVTKFDIAHLLDAILPAWSGNYCHISDVLTYRHLVDRLVEAAQKTTNRRLIEKLSFYYPISPDSVGRFFEDINSYYR